MAPNMQILEWFHVIISKIYEGFFNTSLCSVMSLFCSVLFCSVLFCFEGNLQISLEDLKVVEHWSSNPEDADSIPSQKALELHFSQLVPVWVV